MGPGRELLRKGITCVYGRRISVALLPEVADEGGHGLGMGRRLAPQDREARQGYQEGHRQAQRPRRPARRSALPARAHDPSPEPVHATPFDDQTEHCHCSPPAKDPHARKTAPRLPGGQPAGRQSVVGAPFLRGCFRERLRPPHSGRICARRMPSSTALANWQGSWESGILSGVGIDQYRKIGLSLLPITDRAFCLL